MTACHSSLFPLFEAIIVLGNSGTPEVDSVFDVGRRVGTPVRLATLARLRQGTYRLLSALFLPPEPTRLASFRAGARFLLHRKARFTELACYPAWENLLRMLRGLKQARCAQLQEAYARLFLAKEVHDPLPLLESSFLSLGSYELGSFLAELDAEYARAGIKVLPDGEAPDHLVMEMEFLAVLCGRESAAWRNGQAKEALVMVLQQQDFLLRHPCRWLPELAALAAARDDLWIYTQAIQTARAIVAHDGTFLGALADGMSAVILGGGRLEKQP